MPVSGPVYTRKVSFADGQMVDNVTAKVVKRLIQITIAMKQDGENRVGLSKSKTAFKVSQQMAEAAATCPSDCCLRQARTRAPVLVSAEFAASAIDWSRAP